MIADSNDDWPFTPAFLQVYVDDAATILEEAKANGATIITELTAFYGGYNIARIQDPFGNLWGFTSRKNAAKEAEVKADTS